MRLLVVVQLLAAVSAWRLELHLRSLELPPTDLCERNATVANLGANALHAAPPCCNSFRALQVHRNLIEQLPEGWLQQCPQLEELSVSGNQLRQLPARLLVHTPAVRRLQASRNKLTSLPPQLLANATALIELDLSHNLLTDLPPALLETNTQLEELYLQGNSLASLPEQALASCGRLRQLWLSGNRLERLPGRLLAAAPALRALRLDHNQLAAVDAGAFRSNHQLLLVDLSSNKLTSLPAGLFSNAKSLRYLLLRDNRLRVVPLVGGPPERPLSLDLRDNHLRTVEDFGVFGSSRVWLDGNRWRCGCSLAPVIKEAAPPRQLLWFRQHPLCYQGERDRFSFRELDLSQCEVSGGYGDGDGTGATSSDSASDAVPTNTASGASVWETGDNSSLTATSITGNSVTVTPNVYDATSSLEVGNSPTGDSETSDTETTTSEIGISEASSHVSHISETTTSVDTSSLSTHETTSPEIRNSHYDFLETSEAGTLQSSTTETDDSAINTSVSRIVSPKTVESASLAPLGSSEETHNVLGPDNEADPNILGLGLVTYSTTTVGGDYNSATTDVTVSSPVVTTFDVNTSQPGRPQTDVNGRNNLKTTTPTDETDDSNESDIYGDILMQ